MSLLVHVRLKNGGIDGRLSVDCGRESREESQVPAPFNSKQRHIFFFLKKQEVFRDFLTPSGHFKTGVEFLQSLLL